jgi:cytoskeletal protein CcmA (bactofilin family)
MFKRSEEQEWSRFRGALAKDRDDSAPGTAASESADSPNAAAGPAGVSGTATAGPSFRPSPGDVNMSVPSTRLARSVSDGSEVESLIGERTNFEGTLRCEGSIRLLGSVQGEIHSKGTIYVEERAHVTARLTGAAVTIAGQVDGQIFSDGRVEIRPTGRVLGEINAGALIVQEGAFFEGNSRMANVDSTASGSTGASASTGSAGAAGSTASSTPAAAGSATGSSGGSASGSSGSGGGARGAGREQPSST